MLNETLRYLRIQGEADEKTLCLVLDCLEEVQRIAMPKHRAHIMAPEEALPLLAGEDVKKHLAGAARIGVLAATLGIETDRMIRKYQMTDMARAAVWDAAASAYIEAYCDKIVWEVPALHAGRRFSPGYGDYPLSVQPMLLKAAGGEKIGVTALESCMLLPTKSVTAVLGFYTEEVCKEEKCAACPNKNCAYRNE